MASWNTSAKANSIIDSNESLRRIENLLSGLTLVPRESAMLSVLIEHNSHWLNIPSLWVIFRKCTQFILGEVKDVVGLLSNEISQKGSSHHKQAIAVLIFDPRERGTGYQ